jgi:conjugative relaxase-like TrwC/TraI family protein
LAASRTTPGRASRPVVVANLATVSDPNYTLKEVTDDALAYYLRQGEAPGRWTGTGAARLGLAGEVAPADLHDVFAGKDPRSGEYLTPSRGSPGRVAARAEDVAVDVRAAAARLGVAEDTVRARLRAGTLDGEKTASGRWRVSSAAIDAALAGTNTSTLPIKPGADGCWSLPQSAKVAGVHPSYLKRIVTDQAPTPDTGDDGRPPQYLLGTKDDQGRWQIEPAEVRRFIQGRRPARVVPVYDLVLRAPKSVSILHALAPLLPPEDLVVRGLPANLAEVIVDAHHVACGDAIALLERHAAFIRGPGGRVPVNGLTVAAFDHRSSREGDPLLHTHHLVANAGQGIDGRSGALDGAALYTWTKTAGHVYHARLRHELTTHLGVEFHTPHNGLADLVGVPRAVIDEFSARSRQIALQLARVAASGPKAAQAAALDTRAAKTEGTNQTPEQLAERAAAQGFPLRDLLGCVGCGPARPADQQRVEEIAHVLAGPDGLTAQDTRVGLRDALCGFASALPEGASGADLEQWSRRLLADPRRFVPVLGAPAHSPGITRAADGKRIAPKSMAERAYSTPALLADEQVILQAHRSGLGPDRQGAGVGIAAPAAVSAAITDRPSLRVEQSRMVERVTSSGIGVDVVVGGPGTGKTFALGAAAEAWKASGYRVIGAALQGGAAETLAVEADLDERHTLTALIGLCDRRGARHLEGAIVVVDEAGMADTRQLAALVRYAQAAQAKLVLVGDPDQLPEVGAGGAFARLVVEAGDQLVTLVENHRQVHEGDRRRLALIREGDPAAALASALDDDRLHIADNADDLREELLAHWAADPGVPGRDKLLVAFTVAETERLNALGRAVVASAGGLGEQALTIPCSASDRAVEARELRIGDRVRATRNDYRHGVLTGRVGTITALEPDAGTVTVTFDADTDGRGRARPERSVSLGAAFLHERETRSRSGTKRIQAPGLTHAYATTAHAVQGRTTMRGYVLLSDAGLSRQAAYVACSRAKLDTHLYAITIPDDVEAHRHDRQPAEPDPADLTAITRAMARDASQDLACAADPFAAEVATLVAMPAVWLHAQRSALAEAAGAGPPMEESLRTIRTALSSAYDLDPERLECAQLRSALTRTMRVPGATPERVADLLISRSAPDRRELTSARDPIAVLVWAANHHALPAVAAEAERRPADQRRQQAQVGLRRLDSALARQREGRLAAAETHSDGPIVSLLGPAPHQPASLRTWRRAAAAILDYRDTVGLFDHDTRDPDQKRGAIGDRPPDPARADHYDQVVSTVQASRQALVLADLANHAVAMPPRPASLLETLSTRNLQELERLQLKAPSSEEEQRRLARAIEQRAAALRLGVLTRPPVWVVEDVASRLRSGDVDITVALLASAYMDTVVRADRLGLDPVVAWSEATVELGESPTLPVEPTFAPMGLDL